MKVADYTSQRKHEMNLSVSYHSAADLLFSLWILGDRVAGCEVADLELGEDWFDDLAAGLSQETMATIESIGSGDLWIALVPLLPDAGEGGSVEDFLRFLGNYDPADLRMHLLQLHQPFSEDDRELVADAAEGKATDVEALLSRSELNKPESKPWRDSLLFLIEMTPTETRDYIVSTISAYQSEVFAEHEKAFRPLIEADYRAKRKMARRLSPGRVIEIATNGITLSDDHTRLPIVLIPTMVARPWVVFSAGADSFVLGYPVSDECIDGDPDAPPPGLVKLHKALGDERRLRILRTLAENEASLAELSKDADIAKSTLHHHLMLLRSAGLIRVEVGDEKRYSLREDSLPEAATYLDHYIHRTIEPRGEES
jgi:DNA-binding transcriptional ArsR family regulator